MQQPGFNIPAYKDNKTFEDYRLKVGDRLLVRVYSTNEQTNKLFNGGTTGNSMLNTSSGSASDLYTYPVEKDGTIDFPMVGAIALSGKTIREATDMIEKAMAPSFKSTTVEVRVVNRNFSVVGTGKSAYIAMPQEKISIFKALAMAGDLGIYADRSRVRVLRETDHGVIVRKFDLRSADIIHSEFYYIEPNDVIYIQPLNEQFFSITNLTGLISTTVSTVSFGVLIYDLFFKADNTSSNTTKTTE
jgi:polysaccharide export outer membrane protein